MLVGAKQGDDLFDGPGFAVFLIALPCAAYWPVLFSPAYWVTGGWFVRYVLAPICGGGLGSMLASA